MYTPNEVWDIKFNKAVFGGYDMADVDRAFSTISDDYATLFKENAMLKKKLKVLADTVEDYRGVDEAMRKALITAQNMANEMVAEAEKKCNDMLSTASADAAERIKSLTAEVQAEEAKLSRAKAETAAFIDNLAKLFETERSKFLELRNEISPVPTTPEVSEKPMSDTLDEIAKSLEEKVRLEEEELAAKAPEKEAEPEETPQPEHEEKSDTISFENNVPTEEEMTRLEKEAEKPKRKMRVEYENLKFGADYDIKSED